ncbi:MAG TPA: DNA gyrase modulator, partial [Acidocella sp.]|nr:DNA gyrase modulator [Acidocella sp.]
MSALHEAAAGLLAAAKAAGADVAEVMLHESASVSVQRRLGKIEETERAETREVGLRVFLGRANASVSASAIDPASFTRLAEQAVAMAR